MQVKDLIQKLPNAFLPEKAQGLKVIIGIHAEGDGGGDWNIEINNDRLTIQDGTAKKADLFLSSDTKTIMGIFTGEVDEMKAFMRGDIQFQGSMILAMKLSKMFSVDRNLFVNP